MCVCRFHIYRGDVKIRRNESLNENGKRAVAQWMVIAKKKAKRMNLREMRAPRAPRNTWIFTGTREKFTSCRSQRLSIELGEDRSLSLSADVHLRDEERDDRGKLYVTTVLCEWNFIHPRAIHFALRCF